MSIPFKEEDVAAFEEAHDLPALPDDDLHIVPEAPKNKTTRAHALMSHDAVYQTVCMSLVIHVLLFVCKYLVSHGTHSFWLGKLMGLPDFTDTGV